ncbi:MAG: DUF1294 domain-containing protein [Anaerolineae bacterium]|jgi:uncharacterized membrane protein YsdA (DUF1294 family)
MNPYLVFGLLAAGLGLVPFFLVYLSTGWNPYLVWLGAWSLSGFVLYGIDKALAKARGLRAPEAILNLLALVGGFAGCWAGMFAFRHKSNWGRHPNIWIVLIVSTVAHAVLIYLLLVRG